MTDDSGSFSGGGYPGGGSYSGPATSGTTFTNLNLNFQTQANALVDPSDTPVVDTLRVVRDAAGKFGLYLYSTADAAWVAVQIS